jgi:hypothetical protein
MGTKIGLQKPVESRGLDFSSALTYEFDGSNQRTFDFRSFGPGYGTTTSASYSTINPVEQYIFKALSNGTNAQNPSWINIPGKGYVNNEWTTNVIERSVADTKFQLNHSTAFTLICVLQYYDNAAWTNKHGFLAHSTFINPYQGWALYPASAKTIDFGLANDYFFGGRRVFAGAAISWGDYGKQYFSQTFAGPSGNTATSSFGKTYVTGFNGTFDFTSPSTFFPLQTSTAYKLKIYLSESKAELQTGAGTTILSGAFYTGSNGWQGNQLTVAGAWIPSTGSSISHWNAGKGNLSDNLDFFWTFGTNAGGGPSWSLYHKRWLHYSITYNGSSPTSISAVENAFKIYLNGASIGTSASGSANLTSPSDISYDASVRYRFFMDTKTDGFNSGVPVYIGFVQLYNRVLTATEISTQYNSIKLRFGLP